MIDTGHLPLWAILFAYGVLGLLIGSFLTMLSFRLVQHIDSDTPTLLRALALDRSRCTNCKTALSSKQLVPLLSWLWYRGKATCCFKTISIRYPLIESITALATVMTGWHFYQQNAPILGLDISGWAALCFVWTLIVISITDLEHQLILDRLSLPLLWLGLLINSQNVFTPLFDAVWGAALGYSALWLIYQIHRAISGKEGMGYGDFKLTAALGAWLGWQALIPIFIFSGGIAIVVMLALTLMGKQRLSQALPFGPWLALSGWLVLMGFAKQMML